MKTITFLAAFTLCCLPYTTKGQTKKKTVTGAVTIVFTNLINNKPVVLYDISYMNPFGEKYSINKLKYYISNIRFHTPGKTALLVKKYWLVNQGVDSSLSFTINIPERTYSSIEFLLGVDSAHNVSGAQSGALDPLNDMFWTWRTGYVMQKLEGTSPQSTVVNNKFEYHTGGFGGENNVLNAITLPFPSDKKLVVKKGTTSRILVEVDINKFWNAGTEIKISAVPVCTSPGLLAKQIAANFSALFTIADVVNNN